MAIKIWRLSRSLEDACNASYSLRAPHNACVIGDPAKFKGEELKCSYAAFGEQNKTDNDGKRLQLEVKSRDLFTFSHFHMKLCVDSLRLCIFCRTFEHLPASHSLVATFAKC